MMIIIIDITSMRTAQRVLAVTVSHESLSKSPTPYRYERKIISESDSYSNRVLRSESDIDDDDIEYNYRV